MRGPIWDGNQTVSVRGRRRKGRKHKITLEVKMIETPGGGEVEGGGAAGEGVDGDAIVGMGTGGVSIGIAIEAEEEVISGAEDGGGLGGAVVAGGRAEVLGGEGVGGVDMAVAEQAELGAVGSAVE